MNANVSNVRQLTQQAKVNYQASLALAAMLLSGIGLEQIVGEKEVVFVGFPLKVEGGSGGLMRAVAIVY